jgi:hypothetical protein
MAVKAQFDLGNIETARAMSLKDWSHPRGGHQRVQHSRGDTHSFTVLHEDASARRGTKFTREFQVDRDSSTKLLVKSEAEKGEAGAEE